MTHTSTYSSDVESMRINGSEHTWDRQRTSDEIRSFLSRRFNAVGELDPSEYEVAAVA